MAKQTTFEAGMALMKNGLKLNEVLLVSVRKLDKSQRQKLSHDTKKSTWSLSGHKNQVDINPPVKSSISRFVDLVFGMSYPSCQVASRISKTLEPLSVMQSLVEDFFLVRRTSK
jgi:hypothetical protein